MSLKKLSNFTLLFIAAYCSNNVQAAITWQDYDVVGVENDSGSLYISNLRSQRVDRKTYAVSGTFEFLEDLSNNWQLEIVILHSAKGNNQFVKLPYKIPKDDLCNIIDGVYIKTGIAKDVAAATDLPAPPETGSLCELFKKGNYSVNQYLLKKDVIPTFLRPGYYKTQLISSKKNSDEVLIFVLQVKLY